MEEEQAMTGKEIVNLIQKSEKREGTALKFQI